MKEQISAFPLNEWLFCDLVVRPVAPGVVGPTALNLGGVLSRGRTSADGPRWHLRREWTEADIG